MSWPTHADVSRGDLHHLIIDPYKHEGSWVFIYVIYWSTLLIKSYSWTKKCTRWDGETTALTFHKSPSENSEQPHTFFTLLAIISCDWKIREDLPAMENPFRLVGWYGWYWNVFPVFRFSSPSKSNISPPDVEKERFNLRQLQTGTLGTSTKTWNTLAQFSKSVQDIKTYQ